MSKREIKRRTICKLVMYKAWKLRNLPTLYCYSFSTCLKIAWQSIKGFLCVRHTKLVGVSFGNRQNLLQRLVAYPSNKITFKLSKQPYNPSDEFAVQVIAEVRDKGNATIGFLNRKLAKYVSLMLDLGYKVIITSFDITGGHGKLYGCNIGYIFI